VGRTRAGLIVGGKPKRNGIPRTKRAINTARPRLIAPCPCGNMRPRSTNMV